MSSNMETCILRSIMGGMSQANNADDIEIVAYIICRKDRAFRCDVLVFREEELHDGTDPEFIELKYYLGSKCFIHGGRHLSVKKDGFIIFHVTNPTACNCAVEIVMDNKGEHVLAYMDIPYLGMIRSLGVEPVDGPLPKQIFDGWYFVFMLDSRCAPRVLEKAAAARGAVIGIWDEISVGQVPEGLKKFLIAERPESTFFYAAAVAFDYQCLSIDWVRKSIVEDEFAHLSPHKLPAGVSAMTEETHPHKKGRVDGMTIFVHICKAEDGSSRRNSIRAKNIWEQVCETLGATTISLKEATKKDTKVDVVIAEEGADRKMIRRLRARGIPVVTGMWLVEAVITSSVPPFEGHPTFIAN